jgi:3-oxoadipate CoA-transferase alpha subunit
MDDKVCADVLAALGDVGDGATVLIGGFGEVGVPHYLVEALSRLRPRDLAIVTNNAGGVTGGIATLIELGLVSKVICSFPRTTKNTAFERRYMQGGLELELVPQGTLSERLRAGGAGMGPIYCPVGAETLLAAGKEVRYFDGVAHTLESPIRGDLALVHSFVADRIGNLVYRATARNFNPVMAMAGRMTVAETESLVNIGSLDPEAIVTPGIFVSKVICLPEQG